MKEIITWPQYIQMMRNAGIKDEASKGFWSWVVTNGITDDQLFNLSGVLSTLSRKEVVENEIQN